MAQELPPGVRSQIAKLQKMQEELQYVLTAKQQRQLQLYEIQNALTELENLPEEREVFKIVGTIMVSKDKESIIKELTERKELVETQLKTLQKQEELLRKQLEELNKKIRASIGGATSAG